VTTNRTVVVALALSASAMLSAQRGAQATGTNSAGRGDAPVQGAQNGAGQGQLRVTKVRPNIYMLTGAGGNITVMPFDLGAVVVDTGSTAMADRVIETVTQLSPKPIADVINTSATADHVGGNEKLHNAGRRLPFEIIAGEGPMIVAHEKVLTRMSAPTGQVAAAPEKAWPNETYHVDYKKLAAEYRGGEQIELIYMPAAHSDGDSIVWFRHADVIATGDIFMESSYPIIEVANGGTINGVIDALNKILDFAFADFRSEGGTTIIPGHGRLCDMSDVAYYRDMLTIIRDLVQEMIKKGLTLEQVKTAKPTFPWDGRYGSTSGPWTTDMFVETVYKTLSAKK
jgi:glyoxylase-like metal-dependent hydrolase (beta-lactamase superfamily II)